MATYQLLRSSDVGTTYKRALKRFHLVRDARIPRYFRWLRLIERADNWCVLSDYFGEDMMRKPRDYNAELAALDERARHLRDKQLRQLGELVVATGADTLGLEELAGALLALGSAEPARKEAWRKRGAAFFSGGRTRGQTRDTAAPQSDSAAPGTGTASPAAAQSSPA